MRDRQYGDGPGASDQFCIFRFIYVACDMCRNCGHLHTFGCQHIFGPQRVTMTRIAPEQSQFGQMGKALCKCCAPCP